MYTYFGEFLAQHTSTRCTSFSRHLMYTSFSMRRNSACAIRLVNSCVYFSGSLLITASFADTCSFNCWNQKKTAVKLGINKWNSRVCVEKKRTCTKDSRALRIAIRDAFCKFDCWLNCKKTKNYDLTKCSRLTELSSFLVHFLLQLNLLLFFLVELEDLLFLLVDQVVLFNGELFSCLRIDRPQK